jgi:hypothetical protein
MVDLDGLNVRERGLSCKLVLYVVSLYGILEQAQRNLRANLLKDIDINSFFCYACLADPRRFRTFSKKILSC